MAAWYVEHLGFTVQRKVDGSPFTRFLADDGGTVMIEIYRHPQLRVPDYRDADPLQLHLALVSSDIAADRRRLLAAGATPIGEIAETDAGDKLCLLHDPWGFTLQLVQRASPML